MTKFKKTHHDFMDLTVETYLKRSKIENRQKLAILKEKLKNLEKDEKMS